MACENDHHHHHMCVLTAKGEMEMVKELSLNATVECSTCGAKAKYAENVCDPVELPDIAWMGDGADVKL